MNLRLVGLLAVLLFLFFLVVAGDLVMSASRTQSFDELKEPPSEAQRIFQEAQSTRRAPAPHSPDFPLGDSMAESRWKAAMDAELERERQSKERRQGRDEARAFLQTQAGEYFDQGLRLLTQGRAEEARQFLRQALDAHSQVDYATYMVLIKTLLRSYIQPGDLDEIDSAVLRYLEVIKTQYTEDQYQRAVSDMISRIEAKVLNAGR